LAPPRSSIAPPICSATTKEEEEEEEEQDEQAGLRCGLSQRELGALAGEEEHRQEHHHRDGKNNVLDQERPDSKDVDLDQR
jgi:hypothetical protein